MEIHTGRAQAARRLLTKVISGILFAVRARNEAFSILFLNPPYDFDSDDGRTELSFLKHTLPYLAAGGLLLYLIPRKRVPPRYAEACFVKDPTYYRLSLSPLDL